MLQVSMAILAFKNQESGQLKNIFNEGELDEMATCKDFLQVQIEGNRPVERKQRFYNLDVIISVGYRAQGRGL